MQIINRIKKLENQTFGIGDGEQCRCPKAVELRNVLRPSIDDRETGLTSEIAELSLHQKCKKCSRTIEHLIIKPVL